MEQTIGQLLQVLCELERRLRELERSRTTGERPLSTRPAPK